MRGVEMGKVITLLECRVVGEELIQEQERILCGKDKKLSYQWIKYLLHFLVVLKHSFLTGSRSMRLFV